MKCLLWGGGVYQKREGGSNKCQVVILSFCITIVFSSCCADMMLSCFQQGGIGPVGYIGAQGVKGFQVSCMVSSDLTPVPIKIWSFI